MPPKSSSTAGDGRTVRQSALGRRHTEVEKKRSIVIGFKRLGRLKISTKLSGILGAALVALCAMGAIAIFAAQEIQDLGQDLYAESDKLSDVEMTVSLEAERAIGHVHSAPSELNLDQLKIEADAIPGKSRRRQASAQGKPFRPQHGSGVKAGSASIIGAHRWVRRRNQRRFSRRLPPLLSRKRTTVLAALVRPRNPRCRQRSSSSARLRARATPQGEATIGSDDQGNHPDHDRPGDFSGHCHRGTWLCGDFTRRVAADGRIDRRTQRASAPATRRSEFAAASRHDEIGKVAGAIASFRDNVIAQQRLANEFAQAVKEREALNASMESALAGFRASTE